jgi:ribokinase
MLIGREGSSGRRSVAAARHPRDDVKEAIVVVGSLNEDLLVRLPHWPESGETVAADELIRLPGGKGANQAVAAGRLGGKVVMVGTVGNDAAGARLRESLRAAGVDVTAVAETADLPTGTAVVLVEPSGANRIVVIAGANGRAGEAPIATIDWARAQVLLLQLEIPIDVVMAAAQAAHKAGAQVILDPAPAMPLPTELLALVDVLTPNEVEAELLGGGSISTIASAGAVATQLAAQGPRAVIVKLGELGLVLVEGNRMTHVAATTVRAVDTTGAGDAFNGALAVALAEGQPLVSAAQFASRAAAVSTTRWGTQQSFPDRAAVANL